jgi:NifU-like protein involved in Fe-S cluster formation
MAKNDLNDVNEQIRLIKKELGKVDFKKFDPGQLKEANAELSKLRRELNSVNSDIDYFGQSLKGSIQELQKANFALGTSKKSFKSLVGIAEDFTQVLNGQATLTDKEIKKKKALASLEFKRLKYAVKYGNLSSDQKSEIQNRIDQEEEYIAALEDVEDFQNKINSQGGTRLFGGLEDIANAIPGLNKFSDAFGDASKAARDVAMDNEVNKRIEEDIYNAKLDQRKLDEEALKTGKGLTQDAVKRLGLEDKLLSKDGEVLSGATASKKAGKMGITEGVKIPKNVTKPMSSMMAGIKSLGKSLLKSLGPLYLLKELVDAMKGIDAASSKMAKEFGMTYKSALAMNESFTNMATKSGNIFVTTKGIRETFEGINSPLGTASMMSEDMAVSFTKLRTMSGFTNEELQGISRLQLGTSKTTDEITGQFLAQAKVSAIQNGVLLNEQKLLKDIGKVSAATTLSFGKQPGLIADAVATSKSLGMELSKVDAIASSLLDFESSIENELQAELLLGKDINLEKARQAALNNDLATVAKEIADQIGTSAEFTEMNRIQQDAIAKSVGMSREELASTLLLQDQLKGLTEEDAKAATAKFDALKQQVGEAEAMRILEKQGVKGLENQVGVQDKFNATVEKLKEVFVTVGNAIMPIIDILASVFGLVGGLMKILDPIIQTLLIGVALIEDLIRGLTSGFGLWGDFDGSFEGSATQKRLSTAEVSVNNVVGWNAGFTQEGMDAKATKMATGGIVTGPTRAIVGEAGPEAVIPLSGNAPAIKVDNSETNRLLAQLIKKTPEMAPLGLYEVQ